MIVCIEWCTEKAKNGSPDEVELGGRTEEGKKMAHPAKS
jgi:hypothetical protein